MRTLAGPGAEVHFTHLSPSSCATLTALFARSHSSSAASESESGSGSESEAHAAAHPEGVLKFMKQRNVPLEKVCLLDPKAEKPLAPEDGDGAFEWFLFGVSALCGPLTF